jgi:transcriptional antiterminator RfaH
LKRVNEVPVPLLELEPYVCPANLLTDKAVEAPGVWWALHTRPRAEKSLARRLLARNIAFFLPLYHREWRSGGRLRSSYLPLFPGYLFLHGDRQARLRTLETNLVVRVLEVEDQIRLHRDLRHVHQLVVSGAALSPEDRLRPGTRVEIVSGPLAGMEGKILRRGKQMKFFVEVEFLQQGVSIALASWMFRPLT